MRTDIRAAGTGLVTLALIGTLNGIAVADPKDPLPSKSQVDTANANLRNKARDVAEIRADLAVANSHLRAAAEQAEVAAEAYNAARWRLAEAKRATAAAKAAATAANRRVQDQAAGIAALVTRTYQSGSDLTGVTAFFGDTNPTELMGRVGVVESVGSALDAQYAEFAATDVLAKVARQRAAAAEKKQAEEAELAERLRDGAAEAADLAQAQARSIAQQRTQLIADLATAQKISVSLASRRQQGLEAVAQAKAAAAAEAAGADGALSGPNRGPVDNGISPNDPGRPYALSTPEGADRAIAFAKAQLGEPYLWAADGPDSWDCSGLTMRAWQRGGVGLPHYSAAQYQHSKHIGIADLRPGDLVFWGDAVNTIHHVAMYLGDGKIIHAPRTGQPVQIASMYAWIPPTYFGRP